MTKSRPSSWIEKEDNLTRPETMAAPQSTNNNAKNEMLLALEFNF